MIDRGPIELHLVMPHGGGDDAFLAHATEELHDHFEIRHVTLQVTRAPLGNGCTPVAGGTTPDRPDHDHDHGHDHDNEHAADDHGHEAGQQHAGPSPRPAT